MRAYKTELKPTQEQIQLMNQTFGNCRWVYNSYIAYNQKQYEKDKTFVSGYDYSKYINHSPDTPDCLKRNSSKNLRKSRNRCSEN
jgi:putative transposase